MNTDTLADRLAAAGYRAELYKGDEWEVYKEDYEPPGGWAVFRGTVSWFNLPGEDTGGEVPK